MTTVELLTVIVAAIGCITGVLGFVKSLRVDRRVRLEPYFRNVWSEVWSPIESYVEEIHDWISTLVGQTESQKLLPVRPKDVAIPQIDKYEWAYDKRLYKLLRLYESQIQQLESVVKEYNSLLYPTTLKFMLWLKMYSDEYNEKEAVDKGQKQQEELEEVREGNVERDKAVLKIAQRYIDPEKEHVSDLEKNEDYQRDLSVLRARVQDSIKELRHIMEDIRKRTDLHTRQFG